MHCFVSSERVNSMLNHRARWCHVAWVLLVCCICPTAWAYTTHWQKDSDLVGEIRAVVVKQGDTIISLARQLDVGQKALVAVNPAQDLQHLRPGMVLVVPGQYILPTAKRRGIVINLAELRLYYFHPNSQQVSIYPVSVGRVGWYTPTGMFRISEKEHFPVWIVPESIRKSRASQGDILPKVVYPGPDNPLGEYALRLSHPRYLIHGTNDPDNVGLRVTAGCLRMYPEDIKALYGRVEVREPVQIVDIPFKFGWYQDRLYFESHVPLLPGNQAQELGAVKAILSHIKTPEYGIEINEKRVEDQVKTVLGMPMPVGKRYALSPSALPSPKRRV
jgi:L,D-transpeptidase ErfK/SrfK